MHWTEQMLAIGFVFLLLGAAVWALNRRRGGFVWPGIGRNAAGQQLLRCLARIPLSSQHVLHLVKVGNQTVLITTYPGGVVMDSTVSTFRVSLDRELRQEPGE